MSRYLRSTTLAVLSIVCCAASASAETMRCQSVNGNLNCSGSGGVACQTVDGRQVCVSGHGDVVQSFGHGGSAGGPGHDADTDRNGEGLDDGPDAPALQQHREGGHTLLLERDGMHLHLRTDRLSIDRD
jgi:hypothetical protein